MSEKKDILVCRCEEIYESEVIEAIKNGARTPTEVKRRTRAGMGLCQGKTCSKIIQRIISREVGVVANDIPLYTDRPPLRPVTFEMFEGNDDDE